MVPMNSTPQTELEEHRSLTRLPLTLNNARELGGILLKDGRRVKRGLLLRTTRLYDATKEDLLKLQDEYHLSLVFDMREREELDRAPDPMIPGVKWVHTPVIDFEYLRERLSERPDRGDPPFDPETFDSAHFLLWIINSAREGRRQGRTDLGIGAAYAGYLAGSKGQRSFGLFFHELAANKEGAVLWHCHTGKDRTGIAAGLVLDVLGADWNTILKDYETSNLFFLNDLEEMEQRLRGLGVEEEILPPVCGFVGVYRDMLENAWEYMDRKWGGAVGYLTACCGVSDEEIETLRMRYIEE